MRCNSIIQSATSCSIVPNERHGARQLGPIRFRTALTSENAVKTVALGEAPVSDVAEIRYRP